jgi:hypothetical protein
MKCISARMRYEWHRSLNSAPFPPPHPFQCCSPTEWRALLRCCHFPKAWNAFKIVLLKISRIVHHYFPVSMRRNPPGYLNSSIRMKKRWYCRNPGCADCHERCFAVCTGMRHELSYQRNFFTPSPCLISQLFFFHRHFIDKYKPPMIICYAIGKVPDRTFFAAAIATDEQHHP